jgi:hypothetical protein
MDYPVGFPLEKGAPNEHAQSKLYPPKLGQKPNWRKTITGKQADVGTFGSWGKVNNLDQIPTFSTGYFLQR